MGGVFASGHVGEEENLLVALENGETGESRISGGLVGVDGVLVMLEIGVVEPFWFMLEAGVARSFLLMLENSWGIGAMSR